MKSSHPDTHDEVAGLPGRLAGVKVTAVQFDGANERFVLEVTTREALREIAGIVEGANAGLAPIDEIREALRREQIPSALKVRVVVSRDPDGSVFEAGVLQALAIHLVRRLARRGELEAAHANELLDQWLGVTL